MHLQTHLHHRRGSKAEIESPQMVKKQKEGSRTEKCNLIIRATLVLRIFSQMSHYAKFLLAYTIMEAPLLQSLSITDQSQFWHRATFPFGGSYLLAFLCIFLSRAKYSKSSALRHRFSENLGYCGYQIFFILKTLLDFSLYVA